MAPIDTARGVECPYLFSGHFRHEDARVDRHKGILFILLEVSCCVTKGARGDDDCDDIHHLVHTGEACREEERELGYSNIKKRVFGGFFKAWVGFQGFQDII